jgi:Flp pilus assembly protein TadD
MKEQTMLKRALIVISLSVGFVVAAEPLRAVSGHLLTDEEISRLDSANTAAAASEAKNDGGGNGFLKVLKAPFKAIARLFGRGGKKDQVKLQRLSEKDVQKFETAGLVRVTDATMKAPETPSADLDAKGHLDQGRTLLNSGNLNEAISELSKATSLDSKLAEAHNLLGVAYQMKGLPEFAKRSFEAAVKLDKRNPQILNNLGYLLFLHGNSKAALERLKKAAEIAPDDTRILNNLALVQVDLGKLDDAAKNFIRAGGEIQGRINMANRLEVAGRSGEAAKYYEQAKVASDSQRNAQPTAQNITVLLEIKNGRVIYASVPERRPGLEGYEASAVRIARGLRYPAEKSGVEQVVIQVNPPGM